MKYVPNDYMLLLFNSVGSKVEDIPMASYNACKDFLDNYLEKSPDSSGVIIRILFNSKDEGDKWTYKSQNS